MKMIFAASPGLLLAGAMLVAPASAQTMAQPYMNEPPAPYAEPSAPQPYAGQTATQPDFGQTSSSEYRGSPISPQAGRGRVPQGPYLTECKDVRMLQDTLTAFCPRGDGSWHTTQLLNAVSCQGDVQNAGGDLVCPTATATFGSTNPPTSYGTSYGGTYGTMAPPPVGYAPIAPSPFGASVAPPPAYGAYSPSYAPVPAQTYAAPPYPAYNGYGAAPYAAYPPNADQYVSPSATRSAQPPY